MSIDWSPLRTALRDAEAAAVLPAIWWRDDDAIAATPALDHLISAAEAAEVPVHLAVVPAMTDPSLRAAITDRPVIPVVHGWAHRNHAPDGAKKAEFMPFRDDALRDAGRGLRRLKALLGSLAPMFVPPWNRIAPEVVAGLADQGYRALSTYTPRTAASVAGLTVVNTHVDPIAWKAGKGLVDVDTLIGHAAALLVDRANGDADPNEPLGLLTHHLVQDAATWDFCRAFLAEMRSAGCPAWSYEERV